MASEKENTKMETISDLFESIGKVRSVKERQDIILEFIDQSDEKESLLRLFIQCVFHPEIKFGLPSGDVPKEAIPVSVNESPKQTIGDIKNQLHMFAVGGPTEIKNQTEKEARFGRLYGSLDEAERPILVAMKDKNLPSYRGVTKNLLQMDRIMSWLPFNKFE